MVKKAKTMDSKNDNIIIGSHNTMSYLPVRHWWQRPLRIFARCQRKTLLEQLDSGVQAVDIRIYFDSIYLWRYAHGAVSFDGPEIHTLIGMLPHGTIVRFILERSGETAEKAFRFLCSYIEPTYPGLTFIGGYSKRPWRKLYTFKAEQTGDAVIHQPVSSMADDARWYERILPILYHRRRGHTEPHEGINLYDFI